MPFSTSRNQWYSQSWKPKIGVTAFAATSTLVDLRANARDPNLAENDLHQLPEPRLSFSFKRGEEGHMCAKNLLPTDRERAPA